MPDMGAAGAVFGVRRWVLIGAGAALLGGATVFLFAKATVTLRVTMNGAPVKHVVSLVGAGNLRLGYGSREVSRGGRSTGTAHSSADLAFGGSRSAISPRAVTGGSGSRRSDHCDRRS